MFNNNDFCQSLFLSFRSYNLSIYATFHHFAVMNNFMQHHDYTAIPVIVSK